MDKNFYVNVKEQKRLSKTLKYFKEFLYSHS